MDYSKAYYAIYDQPYLQAFFTYRGLIGSSEPIHFTLSWVASNLEFSRIYFISIWNSFTVVAFLMLGKKINGSLFILTIIALSNLYFFALFTELERLKFAFLFFFISIYFIENKKLFYTFAIITVLTHLQFLIMYSGFLAVYSLSQSKNLLVNYRIQKKLFVIIGVAVLLLFFMSDHLLDKWNYYRIFNPNINFLAVLKASPFMLLVFYYAKNKRESIVFMLPLILMLALVGGDRLNIFAYFIFLYFALQNKRGFNVGILSTTGYYAITGTIFIFNIFEYGRGYNL